MKRRRLIVNADDLGLSRGITDGILSAHHGGIVTSTSLMVKRTASEYALEQLRQAPKLGVGIHLDLSDASPVLPPSEVPSMVTTEGKFYPYSQMIRRLGRWQISAREIEAEFRAQIRWMKDRGLAPTHADSHNHLHFYPCVAGPFRRALQAEGIHRARATRRYCPGNGFQGAAYTGPAPRRLLLKVYLELLRFVVNRNLVSPDFCLVPAQRNLGKIGDPCEVWKSILDTLSPGTYELVCHPGFREKGFSESDKLRERRDLEVQILMDPQLRMAIEQNEIELITYSQL